MKVRRNSGFTIVELLIAITIFGLIAVNAAMVSRTSSRATESDMFRQLLDSELDLTLERIRLALMAAAADNVYPQIPAPLSENHIDYSTSVGVQNGKLVLGEPERIRWIESGQKGRVTWTRAVGQPEESEIQWSSNVPLLQDKEVVNEKDDNFNDLVDEPGLSFHVEHAPDKALQIFITLTVSKEDSSGATIPVHRQINVTCRN